MAAEAPRRQLGELIVPDGTARVLEALRDDPDADVGCLYHPNVLAEMIYATPGGNSRDTKSIISPFCGMHIFREAREPMVPLVDMTNGYWSTKEQITPVMDRGHLEDYETVLADIFEPEAPVPIAPLARHWPGVLRNFVQGIFSTEIA
jgi:hypothetical protein